MKISGALLFGQERVETLYNGLFSNRDRATTARSNSEDKNKYKLATDEDKRVYKVMAERTNNILDRKIGE